MKRSFFASVVLLLVIVSSVSADDKPEYSADGDDVSKLSVDEISRRLENPLTDLWSLTFQNNLTLLEGDAMETLKDVAGPIDHLLLDGWNDIYLPLLKMLEPKFKTGTSILTDNAGFASARPFITYIRQSPNYVTTTLKTSKGATEYSCYVGD